MAVQPSIKIGEITKNSKSPMYIEVMVVSSELKRGKNDADYLNVVIQDKTAKVSAKMFDLEQRLKGKDWKEVFKPKSFLKLEVSSNFYNGVNSPLILNFRGLKKAEFEALGGMNGFMKTVPEDTGKLMKELRDCIKLCGPYEELVSSFVEKRAAKLQSCPATGSSHHSLNGGMIYHILTTLRSACVLSKMYSNVREDVLLSGIILKEVCKSDFLITDEIGNFLEYSEKALLMGYNGAIVSTITKAMMSLSEDISEEEENLLYNVILTSPSQKSATKEALIASMIDDLDAKMFDIEEKQSSIDYGEFDDKTRGFSSVVYKPKKVNEESCKVSDIFTEEPISPESYIEGIA